MCSSICVSQGKAIYLICHESVSLFCQCDDGKVEALSDALQATMAKWKARIPMPVPLELYTSSTFIGLFVEEQAAELLKVFAADFASEAAAKAGLIHHNIHVQSAELEQPHICIRQNMKLALLSAFFSLPSRCSCRAS